MEGYLPHKNLIFFNPGNPGVIFTHPAREYISVVQLLKAQECLVKKTLGPVIYIEDRRKKQRKPHEI